VYEFLSAVVVESVPVAFGFDVVGVGVAFPPVVVDRAIVVVTPPCLNLNYLIDSVSCRAL
jgi:hypothetical protein